MSAKNSREPSAIVTTAERLFPVETVIAVLEALRYDVTSFELNRAWLDGVVRCEARDFIAAHVVGDAIRAGVDPWAIVDHIEELVTARVRAHPNEQERADATFVLGLVARHRRGDDYDDVHEDHLACKRLKCPIVRLADYAKEIADKASERSDPCFARWMEDSVLDIVRAAYGLGYGAETAQAIIGHAAALASDQRVVRL